MALLRAILHDLALVVLVAAGVLGCLVLSKAEGMIDGINATLAAINAPCASFHGSATCGPIAQMSQTEKNIGILAGQGALQVKQSGALIEATTRNLDRVATSVTGEIAALQGTTDALTNTANAGTKTLGELQAQFATAVAKIPDTQPLVDSAKKMVDDGDAIATSPDVTRFLKVSADTGVQVSVIATQGAGIAVDLHKEADELTAPQPWWSHVYRDSSTAVNIACLITHSCPF